MRRFLLLPAVFMVSCQVTSPPPAHPELPLPEEFKEGGIWKHSAPSSHVARGEWWAAFRDPVLDQLLGRVTVSSQSLASSAARARESAALLQAARFAFLPSLEGNAASVTGRSDSHTTTQNSLGLASAWEIDLWGRLRRQAGAAVADAAAAAADTESLKLSLQAQAAQTYFSLRATDAQLDLYRNQSENYRRSVTLTRNRYTEGVESRAGLAQAESQLASTVAASVELETRRATLEHALAVLCGLPPSSLSIGKTSLPSSAPRVPASTPSTLLQRRPDVAAAERKVAAANERIGAARAAFFPSLSLDGSGGFRGRSGLFDAPSRYWSLGPSLSVPIFDRGALLAQKAQADAAYDATVADYRQVVLSAMQETEDALVTLRLLDRQLEAQDEAAKAARESERVTLNQYRAGTVSYINVITAQATALAAERSSIDLRARRLNTTVALFKALGGKW